MQCNTNCVTPWCTMRSSEPYPPQREQRQGLLAITRGYTPRHAPKHVVSYVDTQAQIFYKVQCGTRVSDRYRRSLPVHRSVGCRLRHAASRVSSGRDASVGAAAHGLVPQLRAVTTHHTRHQSFVSVTPYTRDCAAGPRRHHGGQQKQGGERRGLAQRGTKVGGPIAHGRQRSPRADSKSVTPTTAL